MRSLLLSLLFISGAYAQPTFQKTYSIFQNPELRFIQPLTSGGFVVSGRCSSSTDNTTDFCFFKTDALGNIIWSKQFNDTTYRQGYPMNEWATTIRENADGSFVFGGSVDDPNYNDAAAYYGWMDSSGTLLTNSIQTTAWSTSVNSLLVNNDGTIVSTRDDNEGAGHHSNALEVYSPSGNFVSGGGAGNFSIANQTLVKMSDGGYGSIAIDESYHFDPNYYNLPIVTRTNANGHLIWNYRIHHEVYGSDTSYVAICATADTGLMICGFIQGAITKILLTRFNAAGDSVWSGNISGSQNMKPVSIQSLSDGGFVIAGTIGDDVLLLKTDANGNTLWTKSFGGSSNDRAIYMQQTPDNGFVILAYTESFGLENIYIIKTDSDGNISNATTNTGKVDPDKVFTLYPDPFSSTINLSIPGNRECMFTIFDMAGRIVYSQTVTGDRDRFDLSFLPAGAYLASVPGSRGIISKMILKQ